MNTKPILASALVALACAGYAAEPTAPETTPQGLKLVPKTEAGLVYVRPGIDLSIYDKVVLIDPTIAFRKDWKKDVNVNRFTNKVTDSDMANMIKVGKELLIEEFAAELKKGGYAFAPGPGEGVLAIKPAIMDLAVYSPDPDGTAGLSSKTYSDGSGEAVMVIELYDSVTGQLLVQALDRRGNAGDSYTWRVQRTRTTNKADARFAFSQWAEMLVNGLNKAKAAAKAP